MMFTCGKFNFISTSDYNFILYQHVLGNHNDVCILVMRNGSVNTEYADSDMKMEIK